MPADLRLVFTTLIPYGGRMYIQVQLDDHKRLPWRFHAHSAAARLSH